MLQLKLEMVLDGGQERIKSTVIKKKKEVKVKKYRYI